MYASPCCEHVREFVMKVVAEGRGGRPLQVWTYLASGYSDDKICGAWDLTVVFKETCLYTVRLKSVSSLTTNPPPSPPPGHCAWLWHDQEAAGSQSGCFSWEPFNQVQLQVLFQPNHLRRAILNLIPWKQLGASTQGLYSTVVLKHSKVWYFCFFACFFFHLVKAQKSWQ